MPSVPSIASASSSSTAYAPAPLPRRRVESGPTPRAERGDQVEFSSEARAKQGGLRTDLVSKVRAELASGAYEQDLDAKLDVVAARIAPELDLQG